MENNYKCSKTLLIGGNKLTKESIKVIDKLTELAYNATRDSDLLEYLATRELVLQELLKELKQWNF